MIYDYFRVTGAHDTVLDYADLFSVTLRDNNVQEFGTKWDDVLLPMSKISSDDILESLYKLRTRESDQLKTVLELYDMEIHQKTSMPNYQKLKTMAKRSTDQKLRKRKFDARNERIETGAVVTSRRRLDLHEGHRTLRARLSARTTQSGTMTHGNLKSCACPSWASVTRAPFRWLEQASERVRLPWDLTFLPPWNRGSVFRCLVGFSFRFRFEGSRQGLGFSGLRTLPFCPPSPIGRFVSLWAMECLCRLQADKKDVYILLESSVRKWRICTFLHSVRRSLSPLRYTRILKVSRLKAFSSVVTMVIELGPSFSLMRTSSPTASTMVLLGLMALD